MRKLKIKTSELRQSFKSYFINLGHKEIASSPVIPFNDPTLLFVNAGMNQFKDIFTGKEKVDYKRAVSSQKCIRAGGKHNDLDNVGFTARHHTFFEMLGNFSFGDYFKEEAIKYAWDFLTKELKLPKDKLYATVYETDDDAFAFWEKIAPELKNGRILRFGKKDNYWSMGATGPCGPCSEIHYDHGEKYGNGKDDTINGETDRFVEIWNLVFMQYDQLADGKIIDLPKPSVDTGSGLERVAAIMQGVNSNYEIDLFKSIIEAISEVTSFRYEKNKTSHQVVADHLRALSFAIADGAGLSNEGQGYVLRRILRRAARHGRLLDMKEPFMYKLVPALVAEMSETYPELKEKQSHIEKVIKAEEESFGRTLDNGLELFEKLAEAAGESKQISGLDIFKLYDTYGFPYDLTEILANEKNISLDKAGFDSAMKKQKEQSRSGVGFSAASKNEQIINLNQLEKFSPTVFVRESLTIESKYLTGADDSSRVAIVLEKTPFYVEAGGQISDTGKIYNDKISFEVNSVNKIQGYYIHEGKILEGDINALTKDTDLTAEVNADRRWDIMRNHTATHLTHAALREVLGEHIKQSGSYVGPDRLRFDFSHFQPMTDLEISRVEEIVCRHIMQSSKVTTVEMDIEDAKKSGAMALFGEKYSDRVRVVSVNDFSKELCGGTHVDNLSQIGKFFITSETGVASGVRRLEAISGRAAQQYIE